MTRDEAVVVGRVLATADGGCPYCARDLAEQMREHFPEFDWPALVGEPDDEERVAFPDVRGGAVVYSADDER